MFFIYRVNSLLAPGRRSLRISTLPTLNSQSLTTASNKKMIRIIRTQLKRVRQRKSRKVCTDIYFKYGNQVVICNFPYLY